MNITAKKVVNLTFKMRYDEIVTSINLLQGLNTEITVQAKVSGGKAKNLGLFRLDGIRFDRDGNAVLPFKSLLDNVDMENILEVMDMEEEDILQLRFMAVLELPGMEDEEGTENE